MKQEATEVINQIGKLGLIITVVLSLASYIFMIFAIALTIMIHNCPESLAQVSIETLVTVDMDLTEANLDNTAVKTLQDYLSSGKGGASISAGNVVLYLSDYVSTEKGGTGVFGGQISGFTIKDLWKVTFNLILVLAATVVMLLFAGFLSKSLKHCKSPFEEQVLKDATNFSYVLVLWGVFVSAIMAIIAGAFTGQVKIGTEGITVIALTLVIYSLIRIIKFSKAFVEN